MKKKIFFFLPNFKSGGAGKSIYNLCKYLNKRKYDLFIISLGKNSYKRQLKKYCIKIFELDVKKTLFAFSYIIKILKANSSKNTLFISNINYANVLTIFFLKILNSYKVALIERTPLAELDISYNVKDYIKKKVIKYLMFFFYKKADLVISNSKYGCETLSKFTNSHGEFVYPLLDNKIKYKKKKTNKRFIKILTIGRLSEEKKIDLIIDTLKDTKDIDFEFIILGEGPLETKLINKIGHDNSKIKILKYSKKREKFFLKNSDLYVNSSDFEGFPNSVVDAINYSVPVIATKSHGGIYEILGYGKNGFLFAQNNKSQLKSLIISYFKNRSIFEKKALLAHKNLKKFSPRESINKFERLIDKII